MGKGDGVCRAVARDVAGWGERIEPYLAFYRSTCTSEALKHVAEQIKKSEQKLRAARRARGPTRPRTARRRSASSPAAPR